MTNIYTLKKYALIAINGTGSDTERGIINHAESGLLRMKNLRKYMLDVRDTFIEK